VDCCHKCESALEHLADSQSGKPDPFSATADAIGFGPGAEILEPGAEFGDFWIVKLLGAGGMGRVYEAEDIRAGRRVALKVLSQSLSNDSDRRRFLREGRLAASINHPNSIYIFGTEEIHRHPIITMEIARGGTLQDRIDRNGPLQPAEAVDAILQVIDGLEAAKAVGVLHRDIKPMNCFVMADGAVKIGDFGLSIPTTPGADSMLTQKGVLLGTPLYASRMRHRSS
jgi:hypothetical protein